MMRTRTIGSLEVSVVGLGCNNFGGRIDARATDAVVHAALDAGVTLFDTADVYGGTKSEVFLGAALGARRPEIVLASKFGMQVAEDKKGAAPAYVSQALDASLRRLGTDYIDLYQLHAPDRDTPIADTLGALDACVRAGKVREVGCSNFSAEQIREARAAAGDGVSFVSVQNEYNLLHREPERAVLPECERLGMAFIPYFPLAAGVLTGKYRRDQPPPPGTRLAGAASDRSKGPLADTALATVEGLAAFAEEHGRSPLELAVAWLLMHAPVASVIAGATRPEQVHANVAAADWVLGAEDMAAVDAIAPAPSG
jgi:aryl-alcohol dehydrogenase-like predicted oxidoreductase